MKRYMICLYLFLGVSAACLVTGMLVTRYYRNEVSEEVSQAVDKKMEEMTRQAAADQAERAGNAAETAAFADAAEPESAEAANIGRISHDAKKMAAEEYYLVCEDGFLLVFLKDRKTICLYTHIPIMEFPEKEQARLREGIWFESMMEVFNYLESYTS